jgi:hypothetical protein
MKKILWFVLAAAMLLAAAAPARAQGHSVTLVWTASVVATGQPAINSYQVWRGTVAGGETFLANAGVSGTTANITYTDSAVTNGTTYFYVVYSLDSVGPSATPSNEVSAVIPATVIVPLVPVPPVLAPPVINSTGTPTPAVKVK